MSADEKCPNQVSKATGRPVRDLTGMRFGELTVISQNDELNSRHGKYWNCSCSCGRTLTVRAQQLIRGQKASCNDIRCLTKAGKITDRVSGRFLFEIFQVCVSASS